MTYGPVDFLALEFESDRLTGEILPALLELVENKIVRVIDLVVVQRDEHGNHEALELQQLDAETLELFNPLKVEISGIIQAEDIDAIAEEMENNTTAALLLFENLWAIKFKEAVLKADGQLLTQERIPYQIVDEVLEVFASAES
jgi:translation initiation factor IF-2